MVSISLRRPVVNIELLRAEPCRNELSRTQRLACQTGSTSVLASTADVEGAPCRCRLWPRCGPRGNRAEGLLCHDDRTAISAFLRLVSVSCWPNPDHEVNPMHAENSRKLNTEKVSKVFVGDFFRDIARELGQPAAIPSRDGGKFRPARRRPRIASNDEAFGILQK